MLLRNLKKKNISCSVEFASQNVKGSLIMYNNQDVRCDIVR